MSTLKVNRIEAYSGNAVEVVGLQATASNALWSGISGIPAGLVSGSYSSSMSTRITAQEDFSSSLDATFATDAELSSLSGSASTARNQISSDYIAADSALSSSASTARDALRTSISLGAVTASINTTMVANTAYTVTGTAAPITMSLPSSPSTGDLIKFANMDDRATLIARGGSNIMSIAEDLTLDIEQVSFDLVYVGPTVGWTIYGSRATS